MNLIQEFTLTGMLAPPLLIGEGPIGTRQYFDITEGQILGERLQATILGGGEWALLGPDGYIRVDVRLQAETHDGAFIYLQYSGLLEFNETVQGALTNGTATDFSDQCFYTNLRFETGDSRYAWLNTTFFVGQGRVLQGLGVEYKILRPA